MLSSVLVVTRRTLSSPKRAGQDPKVICASMRQVTGLDWRPPMTAARQHRGRDVPRLLFLALDLSAVAQAGSAARHLFDARRRRRSVAVAAGPNQVEGAGLVGFDQGGVDRAGEAGIVELDREVFTTLAGGLFQAAPNSTLALAKMR